MIPAKWLIPARGLAALALSATLAGCVSPTPQSHAAAVDRAACRHRADEVYALQNRDDRYLADRYVSSTRDAPFASIGLPGNPSAGLSSSYARAQLESDCLSDRAGNVGTTPAAPAPDDERR